MGSEGERWDSLTYTSWRERIDDAVDGGENILSIAVIGIVRVTHEGQSQQAHL
jgi:hypothetical protein